ncbi:hypothetical protein [Oryza sativa Japonica Group]|uniref:Uncharacterized protein n=2 Tax=Oryza sativa subsp. japonica TaxID=39947 RepID=Q5JMJ6_ORYSJ|nr:hypothetical protein [Oryza sativa Japonica Group]BAD87604.1 hypothetical protein [Oryza sativa Japonica Group]
MPSSSPICASRSSLAAQPPDPCLPPREEAGRGAPPAAWVASPPPAPTRRDGGVELGAAAAPPTLSNNDIAAFGLDEERWRRGARRAAASLRSPGRENGGESVRGERGRDKTEWREIGGTHSKQHAL